MAHSRNLLVLSETYPPLVGGSGRWAARIAQDWPAAVRVLMARKPGVEPDWERGTQSGRAVPFVFPSWAPDTWRSLRSYVGLIGRVWRETWKHPAGLLLAGRCLPEGLVCQLVSRRRRIPYVCLAHGEEIATCESSGLLRRLLRRVYSRADLVIANSEHTRMLAIAAGALPQRCEVSYPGVDCAAFRGTISAEAARAKHQLDGPVLLSVGRLEWRKNHHGVLRALRRLVEQGISATYLIVGQGEEETALRTLTADLGLTDCVRFLTDVKDQELAELYAASDLFVLPGLVRPTQFEGFGIVFVEAAAAGLPSICGRSPGSQEAVLDGQTGLVVDGEDEDALADAMGRLLKDDSLRRRLGDAARQRAESELDAAVQTSRLISKLMTLVDGVPA